jgi:hypothetical protein
VNTLPHEGQSVMQSPMKGMGGPPNPQRPAR